MITIDEQIAEMKCFVEEAGADSVPINAAILATLERVKSAEAGLPVEQINVESCLNIWSMRPQPSTPSGRAWEDGARKGWTWRDAYVAELCAYAAQMKAERDEFENELARLANGTECCERGNYLQSRLQVAEAKLAAMTVNGEPMNALMNEETGVLIYAMKDKGVYVGNINQPWELLKQTEAEREQFRKDAEASRRDAAMWRGFDILINATGKTVTVNRSEWAKFKSQLSPIVDAAIDQARKP